MDVDTDSDRGLAVVTGASSGIGAATARRLAAAGYRVLAAARRTDRLAELAAEHPDIEAVELDVTVAPRPWPRWRRGSTTSPCSSTTRAARSAPRSIAEADPADWQAMYDTNVLGVLRVTQALLPALQRGAGGHVVVTGSIAGRVVYEGGGGYTAAKHAAAALVETLRLELNGLPVRVSEMAPGLVHTEEFSLVRYRGDQAAADRVYRGVADPLVADDVADCIAFVVTRPAHVNVDLLVVKPLAQAAPHKLHRSDS